MRDGSAAVMPLPGWALVLLVLPLVLAACGAEAPLPTGPLGLGGATPGVLQPRTPYALGFFPPVTGPSRIYVFSELAPPGLDGHDDLDGSTMSYAGASRYVLYDDGRFALQDSLPSWSSEPAPHQLLGTYVETAGSVTLHWDANSTIPADYPYPAERWPGPWEATATITDETLTVTYNFRMGFEGFLNGVYVRVP
jgi:hypothetical protein